MRASELIVALWQEVGERGDREVVLSVFFPERVYDVAAAEPVTSGHLGALPVIYVEAGARRG